MIRLNGQGRLIPLINVSGMAQFPVRGMLPKRFSCRDTYRGVAGQRLGYHEVAPPGGALPYMQDGRSICRVFLQWACTALQACQIV